MNPYWDRERDTQEKWAYVKDMLKNHLSEVIAGLISKAIQWAAIALIFALVWKAVNNG